MARFLAVADESDGPTRQGPFVYGGFLAPLAGWEEWFIPAWQERVLNRSPRLPNFHTAEVASAKARARLEWL